MKTFSSFNKYGITHRVTTRQGGCSPEPYDSLNLGFVTGDSRQNIEQNRKIVTDQLGLESDKLLLGKQVHGNTVTVIGAQDRDQMAQTATDGLITGNPDIAIGVLVADCYPVLLASRDGKVCAAIHAGRRGIELNIVSKAIETMHSKFQITLREILVGIGPGICTRHYPVDRETAQEFIKATAPSHTSSSNHGPFNLDLRGTLHSQILATGINKSAIEHMDYCPHCEPEMWFSHRYFQGKTGRFAAVIRSS